MRVAGVMTGTSADGIDLVVCEITGIAPDIDVTEQLHLTAPLPNLVRELVIRAASEPISGEDYAKLEYALSDAIADLAHKAQESEPFDLIGVHGQTLWHKPPPCITPMTHQVLNPSCISQKLDVPVVWDFRRADIAAGGQGAPLAPYPHFCLFGHGADPVGVLNLGGIANLTILPSTGNTAEVRAWDTGPGMMLIDHLVSVHFDLKFDDSGAIAAKGSVSDSLLAFALEDPYFKMMPPKTCGREEFGADFASRFAIKSRELDLTPTDTLRTAVSLTAQSVTDALENESIRKLIVAGGGARNGTLLAEIQARLPKIGVTLSDDFGIPAEHLEAIAFAILAYERWHKRTGNLPAVTGALERVLLGAITE